MSDVSGDDDWSSWASRLKVGDGVWYQRCEGTEVEARVVEICATSSTCWVQYHVKPSKGGRQNRRALVKVEELMRVQQDHARSPSSSQAASARASEESDSAFEAGWASEGYTPTVAETMPAQRLLRSRVLSMVLNDDEDMPVPSGRRRLLRACSMVTSEEEPFRRSRAISMIDSDDVESVASSTNRSRILPRRTTAASMIFSKTSGDSFLEPREALSMLSEMPEHWLLRDGPVSEPSQEPPRGALSMLSEMPENWHARDGQVSEPSQEPPRGALSMLSEMPEQWFARDGQEWEPSQEPHGSELDFDLPEPSEKGDPDGSQGGSFSTSMSRQELPEEPVSESEKTETSICCSAHHAVKGYCNAAAWPSAQWTMPELVGLEPDHVDVFCESALDKCGTCPTSVKAYTTHKVERELSELCRLLEHKAASLASTYDPDQDDTSSSKHATSEEGDGDWDRDPASFLAPVQPEVSAESETTMSGSAVVATRAEREREADPDASRLKKPGFMDRMLRTFCPSLAKSRADKGERGDEVASLPRSTEGASSAPRPVSMQTEPLRPDVSPVSPGSLGAGVGDIE